MSAFQVARFCRRCLLEPASRRAVQDDPATALGGFDLTDREWNLFGLDVPTYAPRRRAVRDG